MFPLVTSACTRARERDGRGPTWWNDPAKFAVDAHDEGRMDMDVATTSLAERIARALAGLAHSANAEGGETSASANVDETWHDYSGQADAILRTIREPSGGMSSAGDPRVWAAMVDAAIAESEAL